VKGKRTRADSAKPMKLTCGRRKVKAGNKVWELGHDAVVWESAEKIIVCDCVEWEWFVTTVGGVKHYHKICVRWKCHEPDIYTGPLITR
jgi:hypothetical protein